MSWASLFLQGAVLGIAAATAPDPFQTFLVSESFVGGWRRGAPVVSVPLVSDLPINRIPRKVAGVPRRWVGQLGFRIAQTSVPKRFIGWSFAHMSFAIPAQRLRETNTLDVAQLHFHLVSG